MIIFIIVSFYFIKVVLIGAERKSMLKNAIKNIGPCARIFTRLVQRYEI